MLAQGGKNQGLGQNTLIHPLLGAGEGVGIMRHAMGASLGTGLLLLRLFVTWFRGPRHGLSDSAVIHVAVTQQTSFT